MALDSGRTYNIERDKAKAHTGCTIEPEWNRVWDD